MIKEEFLKTHRMAELEGLTRLQSLVIPHFFNVHPSAKINMTKIEPSERYLMVMFSYKSDSCLANVYYNPRTKAPYGWIEIFVSKLPDDVSDEFAGRYLRFQDELEIALVIRDSELVIGIDNIDMSSPSDIEPILEDLFQKKHVLLKYLNNDKMNEDQMGALLSMPSSDSLKH